MFDPLDSFRDLIETAKLEAFLCMLQGADPAFLEWIRVLLENGCPPKAMNDTFAYFIKKGQENQSET